MANIISNKLTDGQLIQMSNGSTSVFFETLCLSGSTIALENYEKDLLIWLGQRDWTIIGMGMEGFDIAEIIWKADIFNKQKEFLLKTIDLTFAKTNWDLLDYEPYSEILFEHLSIFRKMIESFSIDKISEDKICEIFPFDENVKMYDRCETHKVYKNFTGCIICNNRN